MAQDNTKLGYCYSGALHVFIALAMFAYALTDILFPKEVEENKVVFDMVEPAQNADMPPPPAPQPAPAQTQPQEEIVAEQIEKIDPLEIPEPQPEPESEPKPQPQPKPDPAPAPTPKPKPEPKPQPPKKISREEWLKKHSKKKPATKRATKKSTPVKIAQITSSTSNLDNIATISPSQTSAANANAAYSSAMADALAAYRNAIYTIAKRNWKIPSISSDSLEARVSFKVSRLGIISAVRIIESSGDAEFDKSVLEVFRTISIPPPPDNAAHTVTITFSAK